MGVRAGLGGVGIQPVFAHWSVGLALIGVIESVSTSTEKEKVRAYGMFWRRMCRTLSLNSMDWVNRFKQVCELNSWVYELGKLADSTFTDVRSISPLVFLMKECE